MTDKEMRQLLNDFREYQNIECEYAKGYFDALYEVCKLCNIKYERTEYNLHIIGG